MSTGVVRQPPFDREAELAVIGSLLLDGSPDTFDEVAAELRAEDFFIESNRVLYRAISAIQARGDVPELVTMTEHLRRSGELERVGGIAGMVGLMDGVPTSAYVSQYARIVREKSKLRSVIAAAGEALQGAYDLTDADVVMERLEASLVRLTADDSLGVVAASEGAARVVALLNEYAANKGRAMGVPTGLVDVDKFLSGLQKGRLYVLAARPAMGKSALALQAAVAAAMAGHAAAFVSLEMGVDELMLRAACGLARVDMKRAQDGLLVDRDWARVTDALGRLAESPLYVVDTGDLDVRKLRVEARRLVSRNGVKLVVVDYLQLMSAAARSRSGSYENRVQEISAITRGLKLMARELGVPVLALSQLSRAVESRADKRPMLSDLRESGSIEQDADVVMMLYRDEYYNEDSDAVGVAELIIAKQRSGPVGTLKLQWSAPHARFADLVHQGRA